MPSSPSSLQWLSLVATIWLQAVNGPNSDFPVYSSQLKHVLSISQVQLNNLAFASDAGKLFGWFSGIAAVYLPLRLVLLIGAAFGLVGYGVQFLFLSSNISYLSYWHVFMLTALAGHGICWINTVCYLICIQNFPSDSRVAAGISTSYVGLSARVYTALADSIFNPEPGQKAKAYLLLNATAPMLVSVIVFPLLRVVQTEDESRSGEGFMGMFFITVVTGLCAVVGSIGSGRIWSAAHILSLGVLVCTPIVVPLSMKFREGAQKKLRNKKERRVHVVNVEEVEGGEKDKEVKMKEEGLGVVRGEGKEEIGFVMLVKNLDFWLYFFSYMFGATVGLVFLNNLGQIAESRGQPKTSSLVSLASSFGFFGRLVPSLLDYLLSKRGYMVSRPAFMSIMMAPMAGAFLLLLNSNHLFLYISTAVIGACSGSITSAAVSATSELFGIKNFSINHNVVVTNIPIGSLVFGYLAAFLYQKGGGESESCMGTGCYYQTFIIWGSLCSLGTVLCTILYIRTQRSSSEIANSHSSPAVTLCQVNATDVSTV